MTAVPVGFSEIETLSEGICEVEGGPGTGVGLRVVVGTRVVGELDKDGFVDGRKEVVGIIDILGLKLGTDDVVG